MTMVIILCLTVLAFVVLYQMAKKTNRIQFEDRQVCYDLVSAGSIVKDKSKAFVRKLGEEYLFEKEPVDVSCYKRFVVDGGSMEKFGIQSGDIVLVDEKYNKNDLSENTNSIIALKIRPEGNHKIESKLRKFIDFINVDDFETEEKLKQWVKQTYSVVNEERLLSKYREDFIDRKEITDKKIAECKRNSCRLVLSLTRTRTRRKFSHEKEDYYSFHPENSIIGRVQYRIPKERVRILNKI